MPIFEFTCLECSKESEVLVRSAEWQGEAECPNCGSQKLEKNLSVFSASVAGGVPGESELPPCSGMPSNCGRCAVDN